MPNDPLNIMKTGRGVTPIVENARLPKMTEAAPRPRLIGGKKVLMAAQPKQDAARQGRMAPFAAAAAAVRQPKTRPDMQGGTRVAEAPKDEGYVRLRLRVSGDSVSVVGAKAVEGPLVEDTRLHGDLAYEVAVGSRQVASGAIPDVGVRRSFPSPQGPPEQRGHFVSAVPTYEVTVRVPAKDVSLRSLPRLEITLYRLKEALPRPPLPSTRLGEQFARELRPLAQVKGIKTEQLPEPVQAQLRKALAP
jgi:hypothetical protein